MREIRKQKFQQVEQMLKSQFEQRSRTLYCALYIPIHTCNAYTNAHTHKHVGLHAHLHTRIHIPV